jgi:hypothetical protein
MFGASVEDELDGPMATTWQKLKELENSAFAARAEGAIDRRMVSRLRRMLCAAAVLPDAECAIVFHSAWALVHEFEGSLPNAIRHRAIEVAKIRRLHASVRRNPASKWVLRGCGLRFLESRHRVLAQLRAASKACLRR